jgi:MFS family permease
MLIAGRGLQGLGGALLAPAVLSIITTTFSDTTDRAKALAIWSAIAAGGGAVGLLLGGLLTDLASWRWIFFVNVPVGVALAVATARFVPESRSQMNRRTLDLPGAVYVTAGLVVLVFAIVKSNGTDGDRSEQSACWPQASCCSRGSSRSSAAVPRRSCGSASSACAASPSPISRCC